MRSVMIPAVAAAVLMACTPAQTERRHGGDGDGSAETGMAGDTASSGTPAGENTPGSPVGMLSQLNLANTAEIQTAKLAAERARSPEVKEIARTLLTHHTKNRDKLQVLAGELDVNLTPAAGGSIAGDTPGSEELTNLEGAEFDRAFVEQQIRAHETNINSIRNQMLPAADNEQVRQYLQQTLTAMEGHLGRLQEVQGQLGG